MLIGLPFSIKVPRILKFPFALTSWVVLISGVGIAGITAANIHRLNRLADNSSQNQILLMCLKEQISRTNSLEWQAIVKEKIDENLAQELKENKLETNRILTQLGYYQINEQLTGDSPGIYDISGGLSENNNNEYQLLRRAFTLHDQYTAIIQKTINSIKNNKFKQSINPEKIDQIYDELFETISQIEIIYVQRHKQARKRADLEINLSLLTASLILSLIFWQFSQEIQVKNQDLKRTLEDLKQAQGQLIHQEKMAALGQLVAGIAHEINNPLAAIQASASNNTKALIQSIHQFPKINQYLDQQEQEYFFQLINSAIKRNYFLTSAEKRPLKRQLSKQLEQYQIENHREIADTLIDMGVYEQISLFIPLLRHCRVNLILDLAYNLTRLISNNQTIQTAVERASKIVFALRNYARRDQHGQKQLAKVSDGIETVLQIYHNQIKKDIKVIREYQDVPEIWCYPDELMQVWTNLIHNGIQAMKGKGTLKIAIYQQDSLAKNIPISDRQTLLESALISPEGFSNSDWDFLKLEITDSGCGIPPESQAKIFEPFYTTKPVGEGSGLGLHISQQVINKHQGGIGVRSQPGKTTFIVWLPINNC
ncbi:MAG: ATP-binding protein [Xenococcaceae cyanobacterium MO_188.B19]|nr:ATP-binding protein [Xenococcaceae cyanobacterium MO_188.B19]